MPIYEYRCDNGHNFEVIRTMSEGPVTSCLECGAAVEQVFHPVAVHFKGSGFYTTDYAKKGAAGGSDGDGKGEKKSEKSDSKGEKADSKKSSTDSKPSGADKAGKGSGSGD